MTKRAQYIRKTAQAYRTHAAQDGVHEVTLDQWADRARATASVAASLAVLIAGGTGVLAADKGMVNFREVARGGS